MSDTAIATAADYADAMLVARRAKSVLVLILLLAVLAQLGLFFAARYSNVIVEPSIVPTSPPVELATTLPAELPVDSPAVSSTIATTPVQPSSKWFDSFHYLVGLTGFLGIALSIVLSLVLFLLVKIMLVGRLIGVARVTSAYVWTLVLIVLLFPWQAFLSDHTFSSREFIIPGVLYTWDELLQFARFSTEELAPAILKWARFVGFPVLAVLMLMVIQIKSNRGLRQALGEDELSALGS
ncbi:MAG TPA: hypothetical protein PLD59_03645 [Tepidisphaeraceae bacterium]|nr:hypothetical protein [Tepidisphaeraceae bacterium]